MSHNLVIPMHGGCSGRFKLRRIKAESGLVVEESGWSGNLLVNNFFDDMMNNAVFGFSGIVVGTGTTTPLETDTTLQSFLAGFHIGIEAIVATRNSSVAPRYITRRYTMRSTQGQVVGNVSEIGAVAQAFNSGAQLPTNASRLWSRARVLDTGGNPTTITVLSDEFLEAVWELTVYAYEGAGSFSINLLGVPTDFNYEIRPIGMQAAALWSSPTVPVVGNPFRDTAFGLMPLVSTGNSTGVSRGTPKTTFEAYDGSVVPADYNGTPLAAGANLFDSYGSLGTFVSGSKTRAATLRMGLTKGNYSAPGLRTFYISHGNMNTSPNPITTHQLLLSASFVKLSSHLFELTLVQTLANATPPA